MASSYLCASPSSQRLPLYSAEPVPRPPSSTPSLRTPLLTPSTSSTLSSASGSADGLYAAHEWVVDIMREKDEAADSRTGPVRFPAAEADSEEDQPGRAI